LDDYLKKIRTAEEYARAFLEREIREIENSERNNVVSMLSVFEKALVFKYSEDGYESLNEGLRILKGKNNSEFGKLLRLTLRKLPNYVNVVYRSAKLTEAEMQRYQEAFESDDLIREYSFVSTSRSRAAAMMWNGSVLFRILSKTGKEIEGIAKYGIFSGQNEKEVLFMPNLKFRVVGIRKDKDYTLISLEEI